jgi:AmmeMemoRadiSam system protein A
MSALTPEEKKTLLALARSSLEAVVRGAEIQPIDPSALTPTLREHGAAFVTLTMRGDLRGCIGALEPYQPLAEDVREHAIAAGTQDFRFHPVRASELDQIEIEVSRLTIPVPLAYTDADDLLAKLRPHVDGVILKDGFRRATFLPQVWEQLPDKKIFLNHLCEKMGASSSLWQTKKLDVLIYAVEEFRESR